MSERQSTDGKPRQRRAVRSASRSSKADGVAVDMSDKPHEAGKHCRDEELAKIEGPPDKKDVQYFKERCSTKNPEKIRWRWSREEDEILIQMVNKHGQNNWPTVAHAIPGRSIKQCQARWKFNLDPGINKDAWSQEEELRLIRAHQIYGNKWCEMVKHFPGRTNHAIKQHWRGHVSRKVESYLASGLLEQFPGLPATLSVPQNSDSDIVKNIEGSFQRNQQSSKSKVGPTEPGENADTSEGESSDFMYARGLDAHSAKASKRMMARSEQRVRTRRRLDFLSIPVVLKVSSSAVNSERPLQKTKQMSPAISNISPSNVLQDISTEVPSECASTVLSVLKVSSSAVNSERPLQKTKQMSPAISNISPSNVLQDISTEVPSECASRVLSPTGSYQPSNVHSSDTSDPCSLEVNQANVSDLLDMPYCDGLMIIPPVSPHDGK